MLQLDICQRVAEQDLETQKQPNPNQGDKSETIWITWWPSRSPLNSHLQHYSGLRRKRRELQCPSSKWGLRKPDVIKLCLCLLEMNPHLVQICRLSGLSWLPMWQSVPYMGTFSYSPLASEDLHTGWALSVANGLMLVSVWDSKTL